MSNESKIKHLEFIQNIITRHNSNTFMLKGWAVTISAALFALGGSAKNYLIAYSATIPVLMFWYLNAVFLANERCFRDLYNCTVNGGAAVPKKATLKKSFKKKHGKLIGKGDDFERKELIEIIKDETYGLNFTPFRKWINNRWWYVMFTGSTVMPFYFILLVFSLGLGYVLKKSTESNDDQPPIKVNLENESFKIQTDLDTVNISLTNKNLIVSPELSDTLKFNFVNDSIKVH